MQNRKGKNPLKKIKIKKHLFNQNDWFLYKLFQIILITNI